MYTVFVRSWACNGLWRALMTASIQMVSCGKRPQEQMKNCSLYKRRSYHSPTLRSAIKATFYVSHSQPFDFNFDLLQSGELYPQVRRRTTEELVFLSYRRNKMSHNGKDRSVWHTYAGFYTYPTLFYQWDRNRFTRLFPRCNKNLWNFKFTEMRLLIFGPSSV